MSLPAAADWTHWLALGACVLLTTGGQLCLKLGASRARGDWASFFQPWTVLGWFLFGLNTVAGVYAMQAIDLKIGSTWSAAAYPLVALMAWRLFSEPLSRRQLFGCMLITTGIAIFHWPS